MQSVNQQSSVVFLRKWVDEAMGLRRPADGWPKRASTNCSGKLVSAQSLVQILWIHIAVFSHWRAFCNGVRTPSIFHWSHNSPCNVFQWILILPVFQENYSNRFEYEKRTKIAIIRNQLQRWYNNQLKFLTHFKMKSAKVSSRVVFGMKQILCPKKTFVKDLLGKMVRRWNLPQNIFWDKIRLFWDGFFHPKEPI